MESILVSSDVVISNLRRTASKGLISSLSSETFNKLALKYFGIFENNILVGYQCPYSGKILTTNKKIVLEHIIPISSGGGTILFNCIPTSEEVNKTSQKGSKHLINWWVNSKYWDSLAPQRLEKLLQYMLEAYNDSFNKDNQEIEVSEDLFDEGIEECYEADLSTTQEEEQEKNQSLEISYYGFIIDIINELKKYTDTSKYEIQLQNLVNQNVFNNVERQTLIQNSLKEIIKNKLEIEDRSELSIVLNININLLTKSLEKYSDDEIYGILEKRIDNLDIILNNNNFSLDSFFSDKNSLIYLCKDKLTEEDISTLIKDINMSVNDKFNALIEFILKNKGFLPNQHAINQIEQKLGRFRNNIQQVEKNKHMFYVTLTKEQLEYLHNSKYECLREIYKIILNKSIENNIEIAFVDKNMKTRINEFKEKTKDVSLEKQIELEIEYCDVIIIKNQFNQLINFVKRHNGILPSTESKNEIENKLGRFRSNMQQIQENIGKFHCNLTKEQLEYLHNSEYESLREIYKTILNKSIENNIEIAFIDENMKTRINEFKEKIKDVSLEKQIELAIEYCDVIINKNQFNQFIEFVKRHDGVLPNCNSTDDKEKKLGNFRNCIQNVKTNFDKFSTMLSKEQLEYLHNSEYESLREIYKTILNKSIENNIEIAFIDENMKTRINEFKEKIKDVSLEKQIELEIEYCDVIINKNQFNQFINFVKRHNGILPSTESKNEIENKLGRFRNTIQSIHNKINKFRCNLTKEQLEYLHNSEYESLREIYKVILNKAIENNIIIEYVDEQMKQRILEFKDKNTKVSSIEEQIELEREYKDVIIIKSQFNEFINFVLCKNGMLPSSNSKNENEKRLGIFRNTIKTIKKINKFQCSLTKEQLEYLHNSEYESLREIYYNIIEKARQIDYQPYIEIDNELSISKKGRAA